jgi:hypothetical protein
MRRIGERLAVRERSRHDRAELAGRELVDLDALVGDELDEATDP